LIKFTYVNSSFETIDESQAYFGRMFDPPHISLVLEMRVSKKFSASMSISKKGIVVNLSSSLTSLD